MNILFASAEVAPFSKVGGLADVAGSLPQALTRYAASVQVITPLYGSVDRKRYSLLATGYKGSVTLGGKPTPYSILSTTLTDGQVQTWFVYSARFFDREGIYTQESGEDFSDNTLRFFFFQLVILDLLKRRLLSIDILHCNDHHTGLLPCLIKGAGLKITSVFTIHNFLYHGHFSVEESMQFGADTRMELTKTQWNNYSALLEGIDHANWVTTVSPGYARELLSGIHIDEHSHKHILAAREKFTGIINGIDTAYWNPESDVYTPFHYSSHALEGKQLNKIELCKNTGLDQDKGAPIIGSISRLVENKGFPLILDLLETFAINGAQFVFLGTGDPVITEHLYKASRKYPGRIAFDNNFNEPLAHLIEAGSDMFLMPSRFEPCGLNQLYSLRYGTIPIVHKTGGLGDTVVAWKKNHGTGFVFMPYELDQLKNTITQAIEVYQDTHEWTELVKRAMSCDFSWDQSALQYYRLYTTEKRP